MTKQEKDEGREGLEKEIQGDAITLSRAEHEELLRKAEEFSKLQDRLLRSAADFENAKKRLAKDREEFLKLVLEGTIYDLLPVLDHFELALAHLDPKCDEKTKSIREGFLLVQKQFLSVLASRGLDRIQSAGRPFDQHQHEAVGKIYSEDHQEGTILEEMLAGYSLNGKLLRPAKVKIATRERECPPEDKSEELT